MLRPDPGPAPRGGLAVARTSAWASNAATPGAFLTVAVLVSLLASRAARRARQAAAAIAVADQGRAALLGAVSHDLRTPLAAAKAAVSGLRSYEFPLTAEDHDDLLATADESLNLLTHLATGLLDMTRLQAGAVPVFPRPADLGEITMRSLAGLQPRAGAIMVAIPPGLPQVMADPAIMERVIANLTANALRYAPDGSAVLLTARARGDQVELCVVDRGPGVPEADRGAMFAPFPRPDRGDGRHAGTGRNSGRRADHDRVRARRARPRSAEQPGGQPHPIRKRGSRLMTTMAGLRPDVELSGSSADLPLWAEVISHARCAGTVLDPDDRFPVSPQPEIARREADAAIALCMACPVRAQCLELSLRHWDIGQHGVWGGLLPAERTELRRRWPTREGMS